MNDVVPRDEDLKWTPKQKIWRMGFAAGVAYARQNILPKEPTVTPSNWDGTGSTGWPLPYRDPYWKKPGEC